nr:hypothetical protein [Siminovitchia acidinfaciens]
MTQVGRQEEQRRENVYRFGYKGHLAVGTKSKYIVTGMMKYGNLNGGNPGV